METNKELQTAEEFLNKSLSKNGVSIEKLFIGYLHKAMIEFTKLHLSKQAEFIAKRAYGLYYEDAFDKNPSFVDCEEKSIINAGEEYKNSVK